MKSRCPSGGVTLSGFETLRRCFLWRRAATRASLPAVCAGTLAPCSRPRAGVVLPRGTAGVVFGVVGTVGVALPVVVSVDVVVAGAVVVVVSVLVDVDVEEAVVVAVLVVEVVSVVGGGESARAAATPVAKSSAAPRPAISFLSAKRRTMVANAASALQANRGSHDPEVAGSIPAGALLEKPRKRIGGPRRCPSLAFAGRGGSAVAYRRT